MLPLKTDLRAAALARRDAMAVGARQAAAKNLAGQMVANHVFWRLENKTVAFYHAIGSEIDPRPLVDSLSGSLAHRTIQTALPVLLDRQTMVFRHWDRDLPLVPVGFGTFGPDAQCKEVLPDLVFAPLAAFSTTGQRIGYGKGHYDRALGHMHRGGHFPALVGLGFDDQECAPFADERHDIALDGVLTPSGLRIFAQGNARLAPFLSANERP